MTKNVSWGLLTKKKLLSCFESLACFTTTTTSCLLFYHPLFRTFSPRLLLLLLFQLLLLFVLVPLAPSYHDLSSVKSKVELNQVKRTFFLVCKTSLSRFLCRMSAGIWTLCTLNLTRNIFVDFLFSSFCVYPYLNLSTNYCLANRHF